VIRTKKTPSNKGSYKITKNLSRVDKQSTLGGTHIHIKNEGIYKTIFHNSPLGIIHFDKSGKVIDCNDKFSEIIEVPREVLITINLIKDLKDKEIIKQVKQTLTSLFQLLYTSVQSTLKTMKLLVE